MILTPNVDLTNIQAAVCLAETVDGKSRLKNPIGYEGTECSDKDLINGNASEKMVDPRQVGYF